MLSLIVFAPLFLTTPILIAGSVFQTRTVELFILSGIAWFYLFSYLSYALGCDLLAGWWGVNPLIDVDPFFPIPGAREIYVYRFNFWSTWPALMDFAIRFDTVGLFMGLTVLVIWMAVYLFSGYYMGADPHKERFFALLGVFAFCMQCLVTSESLWQLFVAWELVGLCSYLLINFWYTRVQANKAALKAILVNRFGDFFLLIAIVFCWEFFGSFEIDAVLQVVTRGGYETSCVVGFGNCGLTVVDTVSLCFIVAAMSKSAQFGLHTWLPDAMEGPTPVSALLHAATMVTAGVLLLIKMAPLLLLSTLSLNVLLIVGGLTALFGASTAMAQTDLKKVIAFSTCSQLGYMFMACGTGHFSLAFFHLLTHAFFKALLFLCAGVVIHTLGGEQDLRKMGGLQTYLPFEYVIMGIASASLSGVPFLSGFYSKDLIIAVLCLQQTWVGYFATLMAILAAFCTSFYSARVLFLVFRGVPRMSPNKIKLVKQHAQPDPFAYVPIIVLSVFSVVLGFILKDSLVAPDLGLYPHALSEYTTRPNLTTRAEFLPSWIKFVVFCSSVFGFVFYELVCRGLVSSVFRPGVLGVQVYNFLFNRWYVDSVYAYLIGLGRRLSQLHIIIMVNNSVIDSDTVELVTSPTDKKSLAVTKLGVFSIKGYLVNFLRGLFSLGIVYFFIAQPVGVLWFS